MSGMVDTVSASTEKVGGASSWTRDYIVGCCVANARVSGYHWWQSVEHFCNFMMRMLTATVPKSIRVAKEQIMHL